MTTIKKISLFLVFVLISNAQYAQWNSTKYQSFDKVCTECSVLNDLVYVELEEDEVPELEFDTWYYLPYDFDAYKGMVHSINDIEYVELNELCIENDSTTINQELSK